MESSNQSDTAPCQDLILRPSNGLVGLPDGRSAPLEEMILRSLDHLPANDGLVARELRAGQERDFTIAPGVSMRMCWCPPGEFIMGSPVSEMGREGCDEAQHRVQLSRGYWLGKFQITQAQWRAVMGRNPSASDGDDLPVECVSWNDIAGSNSFLETINQFTAVDTYFSLPTEAQWEYAARAGTTTSLNNGKDLTNEKSSEKCPYLDEVAWSDDDETHPVGGKKPNVWGLHDIHGNVWEWCLDWYGNYPECPSVDPIGPPLEAV